MRRSLVFAVLAVVMASVTAATAGCAKPGVQAAPQEQPRQQARPTAEVADGVRVPDVKGLTANYAMTLLTESRLSSVIRYAPEVLSDAGKVVLSEPKAGAGLGAGDVVVLVVAGKPADYAGFDGHPGAKALAELVAGRSDVFVGAGWEAGDPTKPFIVAFGPTADETAWEGRIAAAAGDEAYRIQRCGHSFTEFGGVQAELRDAGLGAYSSRVDPVRCAVVVQGSFSATQVQQMRQRWGSAVAVEAAR
jgi:PASTA domain